MRVDLFDYDLPDELIAQAPANPRDSSRLLVLHRSTGRIDHRVFRDIGEYLRPGDCLVVNDTKVVPARLYGTRVATGGKWEGLFLGLRDGRWELLTRTKGKPRPGERVAIDPDGFELILDEKLETGGWLIRPPDGVDVWDFLQERGHVPLPGYIRGGEDRAEDRAAYQTVYAAVPGAAAAPTAGLHFTDELIARLKSTGVGFARVTLHVGPGTFQPIKVDDTSAHRMHAEWCELTAAVAAQLTTCRAAGGRVVAVGTTAVRTLETAWRANGGAFREFRGETALFLHPPERCGSCDALVTNFHIRKSTLLMLVACFADRETVLAAYREAINLRYRFHSYGDAMMIV